MQLAPPFPSSCEDFQELLISLPLKAKPEEHVPFLKPSFSFPAYLIYLSNSRVLSALFGFWLDSQGNRHRPVTSKPHGPWGGGDVGELCWVGEWWGCTCAWWFWVSLPLVVLRSSAEQSCPLFCCCCRVLKPRHSWGNSLGSFVLEWLLGEREKVRKGNCHFSVYTKLSFVFIQTSLVGEKLTLGAMLPQSPSVLEPVAGGGEAASRPACSVRPACPASTAPLSWLADLTSGNVNKENKGECS